jgi:hypothetical protein
MKLESVLDGTLTMEQSDCMENFLGVTLLCPSEIMGEYFKGGEYKTLSFTDMMHLIANGNPLPSTFAKWYSLEPLYVWLESEVIIPGHMEHWFIRSGC